MKPCNLRVTLDDFALKNANWEGTLYLTKNLFRRNKICCAEDNHNYKSNMCAKEFSDLNFYLTVIGKILIFQENVQSITNLQKL